MYFSGLFVRRQTISFSHTLLCLRKGNFALELKNRLKMSNLGWMKIENWIKKYFLIFFYECQNYFVHCHPWDKWFFKTKVWLGLQYIKGRSLDIYWTDIISKLSHCSNKVVSINSFKSFSFLVQVVEVWEHFKDFGGLVFRDSPFMSNLNRTL